MVKNEPKRGLQTSNLAQRTSKLAKNSKNVKIEPKKGPTNLKSNPTRFKFSQKIAKTSKLNQKKRQELIFPKKAGVQEN
jgi:hypothetical protein